MRIADQQVFDRRRGAPASGREVLLVALLFASMGAVTWAIRGSNGWGGIDGTVVPGFTFGLLWWYVCWHKGIDARGIPLWLGLGIAIGGELGYGQYVSWIRGEFHAGDEIVPIARWIGFAWFAICGAAWGGPGGIALGWALAERRSWGVWMARFTIPLGTALVTRWMVQACPWLFFPHWDSGCYVAAGAAEPSSVSVVSTQAMMVLVWGGAALTGLLGWLAARRLPPAGWMARGLALATTGTVVALLLPVAQWLFFPQDQLGLFSGELGRHLTRTVYTNSQNAIVLGWWIGAIAVAAVSRDRYTLFAGLVIGVGFGIGFPLAATWCLGYEHAPEVIDWWKLWELNAGFLLGLLYVAVLYWAIRKIDETRQPAYDEAVGPFRRWCETVSMALGVFLFVYVMASGQFASVGVLIGLFYVVALALAARYAEATDDRRRAVSFVYSTTLLVFIMASGATSRLGVILGLYDANAADQYAWPAARIAIFAPAGIVIVSALGVKTWQALRNPRLGLPPQDEAPHVTARLVDFVAFTAVVGAVSIWPTKISVFYALLLGITLAALIRLDRYFHDVAEGRRAGCP